MSWMPPAVADLSAEVEENLRIAPVIERVGSDVWRMTIENERVKNVIDFKRTSGSRWIWKKSILLVDGEPYPPRDTHEEFYDLFLNTDEALERAAAEEPAEHGHGHGHGHGH
ncbi:hypothetical protein [Actinocorallia sp. A-T 12471]|uniref:hypothetical protein n=1 Tax=Actinocorallia sp. A-T 12471 TaxID=3089813 RepID=UPI0029CC68A8|nr:hypothetical protein [Actinocorallia sp. A-T 12471]MDX6740693.1 hypothetical protein [Actinocorallia sp. A-T 12471]